MIAPAFPVASPAAGVVMPVTVAIDLIVDDVPAHAGGKPAGRMIR